MSLINHDILFNILNNMKNVFQNKIDNILSTEDKEKIDMLTKSGDGNKLLTDNGTYVETRTMTSEEIDAMVASILNGQ